MHFYSQEITVAFMLKNNKNLNYSPEQLSKHF